jgi:hypothetical protein
MDVGTTVSLCEPEKDERPLAKPPQRYSTSSNTITDTYVTSEPSGSTTNLLPETILNNWGSIVRGAMSVRMYGDLVRLASFQDGWRGPGSRSLRAGSLNNFLRFWGLVRSYAKEPEIALAPDGSLHAEWFASERKRLDAKFSERDVVFGLFANTVIVEGVDDVKNVVQILSLQRSRPLSWSRR